MSNLMQIYEPGQTPAPHVDDANVAIGIDLGTTHSVVAIVGEHGAEVIGGEDGSALVPSAVHYRGAETVVGAEARAAHVRGEQDAVVSIKRLMGRSAVDAAAWLEHLPYCVAADAEGGMVRLELAGKPRSPVEISAEILRHVKERAEHALGKPITQAVITVPAYFDDAARAATRDAARLAGLQVLRLLNEPTAAALAYGLDSGAEGIYAVYDFGGGTFDISILKLEKGVFQVLATGGDTALGGDDIDHALAAQLAKESGGEGNYAALIAAARQVKEALSEKVEVTDQEVTITRATLDTLAAPFIAKTIRVCEQVLVDAKLEAGELKGVVLVGGATRMPAVRDAVRAFFGHEPLADVDPDTVVAVGAALQAHGLTQGSDNLLLDVVPLSLGLETMGGLTEKLIHRNTPIPVSVSQEFTTYQDNQNGMQIHVVQGEREMVAQNRSLARFDLKGIPALPAGIARVKVTFAVDADGLLTVSAEEMATSVAQQVEVKPSYGLSADEMERMLLESMQHAREDISERLLAEAKMEAERAIIELQSAMKQDGELLSDAENTLISNQVGYVREAIQEGDRDRIDMEIQQLASSAQGFAERRMNKAVARALKGHHINKVET